MGELNLQSVRKIIGQQEAIIKENENRIELSLLKIKQIEEEIKVIEKMIETLNNEIVEVEIEQ